MPRHKSRGFEEKDSAGTSGARRAGFSEPRRTAKGYVHAKTAAGEVDHAALSREIIARFPRILAALAK